MSEILLKSLQFPGSDDTYKIPSTAADIGAAPSGYIEDSHSVGDETALDVLLVQKLAGMAADTIKFFRIRSTSGALFTGSRVVCKLFKISDGCGAVTFEAFGSIGLATWSKSIFDNVCTPLEWVNPPMAMGEEYRTTERLDGKPVYIKYVGLGSAPNNTYKIVDAGIFGVLDTVVSVYGWTLSGQALPFYHTSGSYIELSYYKMSNGGFLLRSNYNFSDETCYGAVKYTKTTD